MTTMNEQKAYVTPGVDIRRVIMESNIADTPVSMVSIGQFNSWGEDEVIGDDSWENGDIYMPW
ncbi:MAG: hypothetical protein LBB85_06150 [Dysgonamonadaceae bacterium]|jgi:hypothetical protein|nr:hypothetical protein [Dysgonamonadaceae bacterium]